MRRYLVAALFLSTPLWAQQTPTPDEQAFARLPNDLQALLGNLPARAALQKLDYARQNLIATGNASYSHDQLRAGVETVDRDPAARGAQERREHLDRRGLARPIGP